MEGEDTLAWWLGERALMSRYPSLRPHYALFQLSDLGQTFQPLELQFLSLRSGGRTHHTSED